MIPRQPSNSGNNPSDLVRCSLFSLLRSEMDANREFSVDGIVTLHLRIERPFAERGNTSQGEFPMLTGFKNGDRHLGILRDQHADLHPVIEFLPI